ncbi:MAG: hypothetical protein JW810_05190 [Sedimentisphaerales bacterium]|nr:hypothetical protein [Sedimentisphaerales bacterium]
MNTRRSPIEPGPQRIRAGRRRGRSAAGFTLMEAVFSIMIVGLGVVAMMQLFASGTKVNHYGNRLSTAVFLAEELQAMTADVAFDDLLAYDDLTFNGVDARGNPIPGMERYQQQLRVEPVTPEDLTVYVGPDPVMVRCTAVVQNGGVELAQLCWLRTE